MHRAVTWGYTLGDPPLGSPGGSPGAYPGGSLAVYLLTGGSRAAKRHQKPQGGLGGEPTGGTRGTPSKAIVRVIPGGDP